MIYFKIGCDVAFVVFHKPKHQSYYFPYYFFSHFSSAALMGSSKRDREHKHDNIISIINE